MKKIMFNDRYGLTDAVLQGRKTMTRRIINNLSNFDPRLDWMVWGNDDEGKANIGLFHIETYKYSIYPKYQPDEVVAVAQNYHDVYEELKRIHGSSSSVTREFFHKYVQGGRMPVSNKMFVRADAMPHQIRITNVKAERLQDISEGDCMREGIKKSMWMDISGKQLYGFGTNEDKWTSPRDAFAALIDAISGKGTWESNPYVFVYTFELVK